MMRALLLRNNPSAEQATRMPKLFLQRPTAVGSLEAAPVQGPAAIRPDQVSVCPIIGWCAWTPMARWCGIKPTEAIRTTNFWAWTEHLTVEFFSTEFPIPARV